MRSPAIANIINFVRALDPRDPEHDMLDTLRRQIDLVRRHNLPATWPIQYDVLIDERYMRALREGLDNRREQVCGRGARRCYHGCRAPGSAGVTNGVVSGAAFVVVHHRLEPRVTGGGEREGRRTRSGADDKTRHVMPVQRVDQHLRLRQVGIGRVHRRPP